MSETMTDEVTDNDGENGPAKRGRPRQQHTIEQDNQIFEYLAGTGAEGGTKEQVSEALSVPENKVYLSFYRLRVQDRIVRRRHATRGHVWYATHLAPPPSDETSNEAPTEQPQEQSAPEPPPLF